MLNLLHTATISDFVNPYTFLILIGVLVLALVVLCFTRGWVGLLAGFLLMLGALGYVAYEGKAFYDSQQGAQIIQANVGRVQAWTKSAYDIPITHSQASRLATGTDAFNTAKEEGKTAAFGQTTQSLNIPVGDATIEAPVALLWVKTKWELVSVNSDGSFSSIATR